MKALASSGPCGEMITTVSALLLITHEAALAERCDRQLHLADGRIVGERRASRQLRAL